MKKTLLACALALAGALAAYAAPNLFTYQGRLKEGGLAVTGNRIVEVFLCDTESGNPGGCTSTGLQPVAVSNGLFRSTFTVPSNVNLGTDSWWLEIKIGANTLAPRERLASNAYALFAATAAYAENISAAPGSNGVTVSSNLFVTGGSFTVGSSTLVVTGGAVGINWITPNAALQVSGGAQFLPSNTTSFALAAGTGARPHAFFVSSTGVVAMGDFSDVEIDTDAVLTLRPVFRNGATAAIGLNAYARTDQAAAISAGVDSVLAGGNFETSVDGDDSVGYIIGMRAQYRREGAGAGTVDRAVGILIDQPYSDAGAGTLTDSFGLFIAKQHMGNTGIQTNRPYALYSEDPNAPSVFSGFLGISSAAPSAALVVSSAAGSSDKMFIVSTGTSEIFSVKGNGEVYTAGRFLGDVKLKYALTFPDNSVMTSAGVGAASSISNVSDADILSDSDGDGAGDILFRKPSASLMRIKNSGAVGIGTAGPRARLDVVQEDVAVSSYTLILSTRPDVYQLVFSTQGFLGIGNPNPHSMLHIAGEDGNTGEIIEHASDSADQWATGWLALVRARGGFGAGQALVQRDDPLGALVFLGYDGVNTADGPYRYGAAIKALVDGAPTANGADMPGRLEFQTTPDGTAALATRLTIRNDGTVGIGTGVPQAVLDVVSTGTASNIYAQVWRNGGGVAVASMTSQGVLFATLPPGAGDNLGDHTATQALNMAGFNVNAAAQLTVSSVTGPGTAYIYLNQNVAVPASSVAIGRGASVTGIPLAVYGDAPAAIAPVLQLDNKTDTNSSGVRLTFSGNDGGWGTIDVVKEGALAGATSMRFSDFNGEQLRLFGTHVGVGVAEPDQKLTVAGNISQTGVLISSGNGNNYFAGNVGIGISNSSYKLHVYDTNNVLGGLESQSTSMVQFFLKNNVNEWSLLNDSSDASKFKILKTGSPKMTISGDDVGIGTQSPGYRLDVQGGYVNASGGLCIADNCKSSWASVDNLGNHTATQNLDLAQFSALNVASVTLVGKGLQLGTDLTATASGVFISTAGAIQTLGPGNGIVSGNPRGLGAVDLQTSRDSASKVASADYSAIGGGVGNTASGYASAVGGGQNNSAGNNSYTTVAGGMGNSATLTYAAVGGGNSNVAGGYRAFVGGGGTNKALEEGAAVLGGQYNNVSSSNSAIGGGMYNTVTGTSAVVAGGEYNSAGGMWAGVTSGRKNTAGGNYAAVAGGSNNDASGDNSFIGGGTGNTVSAAASAVIAGSFSTASGLYSFAGGYKGKATAMGAFTWTDGANSGAEYTDNAVQNRTLFKNRGGFLVTGSTNTNMTGGVDRGVFMSGDGLVGIATAAPQAALDVVSTGTAANIFAQIWRNSSGVAVATVTSTGQLAAVGATLRGAIALAPPTYQAGGTYTMGVDDSSLIFNNAAGVTVTLLPAANYPGRILYVKTVAAGAVVSASSNVAPLAGGSGSTAILGAVTGKWAILQSDGTDWVIMAAN